MYISQVHIENYRSFNDFKISLNEGLSIIIGENNVGKSNFLESLNLVFNRNYSLAKKTLQQEDFWSGLIIKDKWPEVKIEITLRGIKTEDELAVTSKWLTRNPEEAKLTYKFRPKSNISAKLPKKSKSISEIQLPLHEYEWVIYGGEIETTDAFDFNMLAKFGIEYVGALRDATSELKKSSGQLQQILKSLDIKENELDRISKKLEALNKEIIKGNGVQETQAHINRFLGKITGFSRQEVKIQMSENDYASLLKDLKVLIGSVGENAHPVNINGLGYNNLLYISMLLTKFTTLKELKKNSNYLFPILIVEEPEAHLHTHLQKYLAKYFFGQEVVGQVIMTTHSTHVSSHADLDSLIVFYKKSGRNYSRRIGTIFDSNNKEQREYKQHLKRWLDATKSDIFFGKKVLLLEGIAERLLMPKFFSILYNSKDSVSGWENTLESEGISLISVDGVAFRPFLQLFSDKGLGIKCAVLTDSDPEAIPVRNENGEEVRGTDGKILKEKVYPFKEGQYEICSRTAKLKSDYCEQENVYISTNLKTFEYDLILENNQQFFLELIEKHKIGTAKDRTIIKGLKGHEFAKEAYELISKEKGQFSQYILDEINDGKTINIPSYIREAFEFLMERDESDATNR
ncbi:MULTISPECIES: ATP-dependent nuclease [Bacillus]|uniref:ATP-dependent nuclease n=1 Tax=Bacillus TaxID=1386 RepID=UPI00165CB20C|nr:MULTISPECIES: AAA family ATPase [Bacillus subtilis group]MCY8203419.1 AAA family ATPase [Bacillus sp. N12A5]MCY8104006.1 AAA family ATPase [Bacillus mojavensis]MCY8981395.1 AAA family ATPase [Bacillus halotolerans]MEC1423320.1 AAA family ATPase [Bacillus subtilis]MEC1580096.1 AAA family ATPase [Bacillus subtilis]